MKTKVPNITLLGGLLFFFFGVLAGFNSILNTMIAISGLEGILCSYIAAKKDRNANTGFWAGLFFGPFAIIYYLVCKRGLNKKEKELYNWELEKQYKKMMEEKSK